MGVPSLFRWFEKKFPGVVRKPDPKLDTCDNLYIDANSIIHNVCHPGHRPPPSTEEQMMVEIEAYITHVIKTANPTKLVFIAIDGVAPQAKISQQRTRRFRAAKEASEIKAKKAQFIKAAREQGITRYNKLSGGDDWDSNAITPGTPFMAKLDAHLQAWILRKPKTDPYFIPLTIILSGSAVPGEGEHKAMDFIRRQRCQPGYKPLKHAFYGPDADLILLALATHEPSFRILREDPREKHDIRCIICQSYGHAYKNCLAIPDDWTMPSIRDNEEFTPPRLIFFDVWLLRIALETYLRLPGSVDIKLENGNVKKQALYNHE
ncbi:hypothetical protein P389DRAFT_160742, partial [Cystobasidium minutum MCA 4210]|uniref:uncharacterized protein n=1 Tax=Cystobasidium minutum MCA 4210 TaxID=1397322 RepID=UPI0034CECAC0|eukprot:jgi/Rhomi1/160742/estExt_Genewise1Plus.C_4_t20201